MLVISVGLPKSGSALYFNLTNDLLVAAGKQDVRQIKKKFSLEPILKYHNCNVGDLSWNKIKRLLVIHFLGNSFVVKTHSGPTRLLRVLIYMDIVKVTCIYRDPRDVLLSAMDHGKRILNSGENHSFASCSTVDNTIPQVTSWLEKSLTKWMTLKKVLLVKYEDLMAYPIQELDRLADFLRIDISNIILEKIFLKYNEENLDEKNKDYLHFNKGLTGRFAYILTQAEIATCNQHFAKYLELLGYPL